MVVAPQSDDDMKLVVDAARAAVDQEFQVAERLDAKARNQMTVAGTWYALVTGFAGIALRLWVDGQTVRVAVAFVIVLAGAAGGCLVIALAFSVRVWKLRVEPTILPDGLLLMVRDAHDPNVDLPERMVDYYRAVLARRRASNRSRAENFDASLKWWILSLAFGMAELIASLIAIARS